MCFCVLLILIHHIHEVSMLKLSHSPSLCVLLVRYTIAFSILFQIMQWSEERG
jgi:hypothetical protein